MFFSTTPIIQKAATTRSRTRLRLQPVKDLADQCRANLRSEKSVSYSRVLLACLAGRQSMIPCWEALFARFLAGSGRHVRTNSSRKLL